MIHAALTGFVVLTLALASCRSRPPEKVVSEKPASSPKLTQVNPPAVGLLARQLANEQRTHLVTEFSFQEGSAGLPVRAEKKLTQLIADALEDAEVKEVQLITWADREYPTSDRGNLAQKQKRLVENRNEAIKRYLHGIDGSLQVRTVSMAKRPGKLSRFISSKEAQLKDSLEEFSILETDQGSAKGQASRSIVIVIPERTQEKK